MILVLHPYKSRTVLSINNTPHHLYKHDLYFTTYRLLLLDFLQDHDYF